MRAAALCEEFPTRCRAQRYMQCVIARLVVRGVVVASVLWSGGGGCANGTSLGDVADGGPRAASLCLQGKDFQMANGYSFANYSSDTGGTVCCCCWPRCGTSCATFLLCRRSVCVCVCVCVCVLLLLCLLLLLHFVAFCCILLLCGGSA